jgi:ribosomal protein S7
MQIRLIRGEDIPNINELNRLSEDFKLGTITDAIVDRIVYEGEQVVAYGIVKKMAEAIMLTNPKVPLTLRGKAMRELMIEAEIGAKKFGCSQMHCFVKDPKLADTLIKHFGFVQTQDIVLVKGI